MEGKDREQLIKYMQQKTKNKTLENPTSEGRN